MNKKVIIFANPYKPSSKIGTKRVSKFVKYLPDNGWDPIVFAPKVNGSEEYDNLQPFETNRVPIVGPSLLYDLARKLFPRKKKQMKSTNSSSPVKTEATLKNVGSRRRTFNEWLFIPDEFNLWSIYAGFQALKKYKNRKEEISAVFATGPFFSTFLAGYIFSKFTKVPLILDFRDPWIESKYISYRTKFHENMNIYLEKLCVGQASKVITVSPHVRELFIRRYPQYRDKFTLLYNGYDVSDIQVDPTVTEKENEDLTVITYTGTFYGEKSPASFLKALKELKDENLLHNIKVNFVGDLDPAYKKYVKEHGLEQWVDHIGFVPYEESLKHQLKSTILLLIPGPDETTLPGKFYEYLYLKKPILCVGIRNSAIEELLDYTNSGVMADNDDVQDIKEKLKQVLNGNYSFTFDHIDEFNFEGITKRLSEHLEQEAMMVREGN